MTAFTYIYADCTIIFEGSALLVKTFPDQKAEKNYVPIGSEKIIYTPVRIKENILTLIYL